MVVIHIVDRVKAGHGRGLSALELARAQWRAGWRVRLLVSGVHDADLLRAVPFYESLLGDPDVDVYRRVAAIGQVAAALAAKTCDGDTLVCHEGVDLAAARRLPHRRVVAAVHSDPAACLRYLPADELRPAVRRADHWVAWGSAVAARIREEFAVPAEHVTVSAQAVETRPPSARTLAGSPVVLTVARIHPVKNHADMLRACAFLARRAPGICWHMAGGCEQPTYLGWLQALAARLGVTRNVVWHGYRPDVKAMMRGSHVTVLASHHEGVPRAIQEAMALGVPTVLPAALARDLSYGGLPVTYRPDGPEALARAVEEALAVDKGRLAAAACWVGRTWAWERILGDWARVV